MTQTLLFSEEEMAKITIPQLAAPQSRSKPRHLDSVVPRFSQRSIKSGKYGIPLISAYRGKLPRHFVPISEIQPKGAADLGVACFEHDEILRRIISSPAAKLNKLRTYACVAELDCSVRVGNTMAEIIESCRISHEVACFWAEQGLQVIPTMKWGDSKSFGVCFDGYEKGGVVLVSTIGISRDMRCRTYFRRGFQEMLKRIQPDVILFYGDYPEWIERLVPEGVAVRNYKHARFQRMRGYGK